MMPAVLASGIAYSDFWLMTLREIRDCFKHVTEKEKTLLERREKHELICAATTAYYAGYYSRVRDFPDNLEMAFPKLFGLTENGRVPIEDWRLGKEKMMAMMIRHNSKCEKKGGG